VSIQRIAHLGRHAGQVESGGEMLALAVEHGGAQCVVGVVVAVDRGQLAEHGQVEGVALGRTVQTDDQHRIVALDPQCLVGQQSPSRSWRHPGGGPGG
jgi:hypothetical protein